jgi:hypothetical protein
MVGVGMSKIMPKQIIKDERIEKSIRRLKALGLKIFIDVINDDLCSVVIDSDSIIDYIKRVIAKQIGYPNFRILYDKHERLLLIYFWRGEIPKVVEDKTKEVAYQ